MEFFSQFFALMRQLFFGDEYYGLLDIVANFFDPSFNELFSSDNSLILLPFGIFLVGGAVAIFVRFLRRG